ncbi:hypothetical protein DSW25_08915 [Sulfitobacter donghicola DSW-25 = KCTC 12864 = JCM 14565]|uniref:Transposase IS116/IS110/IS902 C-terminal domain-containing protein n=1 Tax=Sulfitobacter donghicola DSW-25 = KCTC 12864 = JCM 14565 TaxID=1300350 RepID=A0A073IDQ9_9RHOB|nr:hypothetical protein DSW25_08915 [Sulfitobacter donghicola DSW-25 = KCTC 12864 = JCM 14565]
MRGEEHGCEFPTNRLCQVSERGLRAFRSRPASQRQRTDMVVLAHIKELERLVTERAPDLMASHGIATLTIAEMLILVGDDPTRIRSEAAFAKLCGVCPIPASSGKTHRFRLNRGGNRQANAALYRVAIVRMRSHELTLAYVKKRTKDGKSKSEIIRCLKRYIVREIYSQLCVPKTTQITA